MAPKSTVVNTFKSRTSTLQNLVLATYTNVYMLQTTYTHKTQLLMFIYFQIINLSYRYILFYVIAIKELLDTCYFLCRLQIGLRRRCLEHKMPGAEYYAVVLCI